MKTVKTIFAFLPLLFAAVYTNAQSGMMEPVGFKLKNGISVIVAENSNAPKIYSKFTVEDEQGNQNYTAGVTEILNRILTENTAQLANQIVFNEKGGNINASAAEFNNALTALSNAIQSPDLSSSRFEKTKASLIAEIKQNGQNDGKASVADLEGITLKEVKEFYTKNMVPSKAVITIAGNIQVPAAKNMVQKTFGSWKAGSSSNSASSK